MHIIEVALLKAQLVVCFFPNRNKHWKYKVITNFWEYKNLWRSITWSTLSFEGAFFQRTSAQLVLYPQVESLSLSRPITRHIMKCTPLFLFLKVRNVAKERNFSKPAWFHQQVSEREVPPLLPICKSPQVHHKYQWWWSTKTGQSKWTCYSTSEP